MLQSRRFISVAFFVMVYDNSQLLATTVCIVFYEMSLLIILSIIIYYKIP
jgi:hypothetical protein